MQHRHLFNTLRLAGLTVGMILFLFMIYRSGQTANNPIYIKGKPQLQPTVTFAMANGLTFTASGIGRQNAIAGAVELSRQQNLVTNASQQPSGTTGATVLSAEGTLHQSSVAVGASAQGQALAASHKPVSD